MKYVYILSLALLTACSSKEQKQVPIQERIVNLDSLSKIALLEAELAEEVIPPRIITEEMTSDEILKVINGLQDGDSLLVVGEVLVTNSIKLKNKKDLVFYSPDLAHIAIDSINKNNSVFRLENCENITFQNLEIRSLKWRLDEDRPQSSKFIEASLEIVDSRDITFNNVLISFSTLGLDITNSENVQLNQSAIMHCFLPLAIDNKIIDWDTPLDKKVINLNQSKKNHNQMAGSFEKGLFDSFSYEPKVQKESGYFFFGNGESFFEENEYAPLYEEGMNVYGLVINEDETKFLQLTNDDWEIEFIQEEYAENGFQTLMVKPKNVWYVIATKEEWEERTIKTIDFENRDKRIRKPGQVLTGTIDSVSYQFITSSPSYKNDYDEDFGILMTSQSGHSFHPLIYEEEYYKDLGFSFAVEFAGDINNDGIIDLILNTTPDEVGEQMSLFMSTIYHPYYNLVRVHDTYTALGD